MTTLEGLAWIAGNHHGAAWSGRAGVHDDLRALYRALRGEGVLPDSMPNFARFDEDSRRLCLAAGLALHDAGLRPGSPEVRQTGLLIAGPDGATAANLAYFRDYAAGGRVLGRGNLFIYTLPTSPGAEAAIGYGLGGPLLYLAPADDDGLRALRDAWRLVRSGEVPHLLFALAPAPGELVCAALGERPAPRPEPPASAWPDCVRRLAAAAKGCA